MQYHRHLLPLALLSLSAAASSHQPITEGLHTLRGFRIGAACEAQAPAYDAMRNEGFLVAETSRSCSLSPGRYRTDRVLLERDGQSELVELWYAPDSTLWRAKVSLTWSGVHSLSVKPSPAQVNSSLSMRFGTPYAVTGVGALEANPREGEHSVAYAWAASAPAGRPSAAVDGFGWARWSGDLKGVVTQANLKWFGYSPQQTLAVEMTDRSALPGAVAAQEADARLRRAQQNAADASMLSKL